MYVAGIDVGSTITKCIILNADGHVCARTLCKTGIHQDKAVSSLFDDALSQAGLRPENVSIVTSTGYGRKNVSFKNYEITEISAHAKGARFLFPDTQAVIDAGGQDCKAIRLDGRGLVDDFAINDRCAAGTGRFLENMSERLGLTVSELGNLAAKAQCDRMINSTCTVFAESEVVSLLADNIPREDVVIAICRSAVEKIANLASRVRLCPPITATGGVFENRYLASLLADRLSCEIYRSEEPQYVGALGAACFSLERLPVSNGAARIYL